MTGLGNMDDVYKHYLKVIDENKRLEKKLEIAVKCLNEYADAKNWLHIYDESSFDFSPIYWHRKWKKEYGYKPARIALKKIGEIRCHI